MKLIIGLGNPGKGYAHTRHNAGFDALDRLAEALGVSWSKGEKRHAVVAKTTTNDTPLLLAKPTTFMNLSGQAVQALLAYYKIDLDDLLVVQDEMDIAPGGIAFVKNGGAAGHNGVADIQEKLGSKDFARLRIGVGRPAQLQSKESWVLERPTGQDAQNIGDAIQEASEAALDWATLGLAKTMNIWH